MTSPPTPKWQRVEVLPGVEVDVPGVPESVQAGPYEGLSKDYVQKYMASGQVPNEAGPSTGTASDRFKGIASGFIGIPGDWQELAEMAGDKWVESLMNTPLKNVPGNKTIGAIAGLYDLYGPQRTLPNTYEIGEKMGADTSSDEFMFGSFGLPGLEDAFRPHVAMTLLHGTPHKFEKFDYSKINTGEGAQAFGYGLYFSQDAGTARNYQRNLSGGGANYDIKVNTLPWNSKSQTLLYDASKVGDWEVVEKLSGVKNQREFDAMMRGLANLEDSAQYAPFSNVNDYIEGFLDDYIDDMHFDAFGENLEQFTPPGEKLPKIGRTSVTGDEKFGLPVREFKPLDTPQALDDYVDEMQVYINKLDTEERMMAEYALDEFKDAVDQRNWLVKNADSIEMTPTGDKGHFYDVDIPDARTARWMRWNEPLHDQPKNVQEAFDEVLPVDKLLEQSVRYGKPKDATWSYPEPRPTLTSPPQPGDPFFQEALDRGWIKGQKSYNQRTGAPTNQVIYYWSGSGSPEADPRFQKWFLVRDGEWGNTSFPTREAAEKASAKELDKVRAKARKWMQEQPGEELYYELSRGFHDLAVDAGLKPGTRPYKSFTEAKASEALNEAGVKGHLFLRGGKRDRTVGNYGDYNAVIYTTDEIEQVKRDGEIVYTRPKPETAK